MKKIRKKFFLLGFILILLIVLLFFERNNEREIKKIMINGEEFLVEVSDNQKEIRTGLSKRENICNNCGMLFVFPQSGKYSFWMKGMKFGLDIIWIKGSEVVFFAENIDKNYEKTISPISEADKVLELKSGSVEKLGLKLGDKIEF